MGRLAKGSLMPAALIMDRCIFLHAPKTGGTWAASALTSQGIVRGVLRGPHDDDHPTLEEVRVVLPDLPAIAGVRHPVGWLRSFWRFFYARDWRPGGGARLMEPLLALAAPTFAQFGARYVTRRAGYVTELQRKFVDGAQYVCRQESLGADLVKALRACGQEHIPSVFERHPLENVSRQFAADCPENIEQQIEKVDGWLLEQFYG